MARDEDIHLGTLAPMVGLSAGDEPDYLDYDIQGAGAGNDTSKYNGITVGANYFMTANVKATVEWGMNLKSFGSDNIAQGFREDAAGKKDQWALRGQIQLMF